MAAQHAPFGRARRAPLHALLLIFASADLALSQAGLTHEAQPASADAAPINTPDVLAVLPANVVAAVAARDLTELDKKLHWLAERLGVPVSPYTLAKGWLEIVDGVEDHASAAIALIPGPAPQEDSGSLTLVLPCHDLPRLLSFLNPRPAGDGVFQVTLRGRESFVKMRNGYAFFAPAISTIARVISTKTSLAHRLDHHQRAGFAASDLSVWLDASSPDAHSRIPFYRNRVADAAFASIRRSRPSGMIQLSARVEESGLKFQIIPTGSGPPRSAAVPETDESLLVGLPDEPFALAMGMSAGGSGAHIRALAAAIVNAASEYGILDDTKAADLSQTLDLVLRNVRSLALSASLLPEESEGRLGVAMALQTTSSYQTIRGEIEALVRALQAGFFVDPGISRAAEQFRYRRDAESISGVSVDHLEVDFSGFDPVYRARVQKILGSEGLRVRIALIDGRHLAVSLGGGNARFEQIVSLIRGSRAPLANDAGTMLSALGVSRTRSFEAYLSLDRTMRLVNSIRRATDLGPALPAMPETNAPIAAVMRSPGIAMSQLEVFVPIELIVSFKAALEAHAPAGDSQSRGPAATPESP